MEPVHVGCAEGEVTEGWGRGGVSDVGQEVESLTCGAGGGVSDMWGRGGVSDMWGRSGGSDMWGRSGGSDMWGRSGGSDMWGRRWNQCRQGCGTGLS